MTLLVALGPALSAITWVTVRAELLRVAVVAAMLLAVAIVRVATELNMDCPLLSMYSLYPAGWVTERRFSPLMKSKEEGTAIAIRATVLGMEPIVTAVEDVYFDDGLTIIVLKHYDATGYILPSKRLNLLEIQSVCPFTTPFSNPYLQNLNKDKSWFF